MEAMHARSMTAFVGLCAAAVVVLSQSAVGSPSVGDAIARAGEPARLITQTVTLSAAEQVAEVGGVLVAAVNPLARVVAEPEPAAPTAPAVLETVSVAPAPPVPVPAPAPPAPQAHHGAKGQANAPKTTPQPRSNNAAARVEKRLAKNGR